MSDTINRIVFDAEDRNVESTITRLRNSARQLAQEMIADARTQNESASQIVTTIREQIRAIEQRNRTDTSLARIQLERDRQGGNTTPEQFTIRQQELALQAREDNAQVQVLREILNQLVENAEEDARALSEGRDPSAINPQDEIDVLQRALALQRSGGGGVIDPDQTEQEQAERTNRQRGRSIGGYAQMAANQGGQILASSNEVFAAAAMVGLIPVVGQALSTFFNKALQEGAQLEQARGGLQSMTLRGVGNQGGGGASFGVNMADFMSNYATQAARAQGSVKGSEQGGMDLLLLQKAMGLDAGLTSSTMRNQRNNPNDTMDVVATLYQTLVDQGISDKNDFTMLGEYLNIANEIARQQLTQFGEVQDERNTALISALAKVSSTPEALQPLIAALQQGIQSPQNQFAQAFQYSVMSQLNPNASRVELMKMQEKGLAQPGLLNGVLGQFGNIAGNNEEFFVEQVKAAFPQLSFQMAQNLVRKYRAGDLAGIDEMVSSVGGDQLRGKLRGRAGAVTGTLTAMTAEQDNAFATGGTELIGALKQLTDQLGGTDGAIKGILGFSSDILGVMTSGIAWMQSVFGGATTLPSGNGAGKYNPPTMAGGYIPITNSVKTGRENK